MPQIAAFAAAAVSFVNSAIIGTSVAFAGATGLSYATANAVVMAGVNAAVSVGAQAAATAIQGKPRAEGSATEFRLDTDAGIPFAFGRVGVAGVPAYRKSYGATNRYQSIVSTLSGAGPIQSYEAFYSSGELTTFDGSTGEALTGDHVDEMWLQRKLGAQPETAHTSPAGLEGSAAAPGWTTDHKMSGRATAMWTLYENSKLTAYKGGVPQPRHVILGKYGWDPRLDSTWPGGSGSCRLLDPTTWVPIDEGCIAALNWSIGMWEGDSGGGAYGVPYACTLVGGIGSSLEGIDVDSFVNGANVADANNWKLAAYPTTKDDKYAVLTQMLAASGCLPSRTAGKISCICPAEEVSSILTVTAADTAGPVEVSLGQSRLERRNTALPQHWSEDADWQMVQLAPVTDAEWVTEDGGKRTRPAEYPYVPAANQAAQLAYYDLAHDREAITGTVPFKPHMRQIAPGDCFTFSEPGFLLDGIKVRCLKRAWDPMTGTARITFRQETDAKHAAALAVTGTAPGAGTPGGPPTDEVDDPTAFTATVSGDEVTLQWTVGETNYFRTLIHISDSNDFATATQIASRGHVAGSTQTFVHKPGPGTWYYWVQGRSYSFELSGAVGPEEAVVTTVISSADADANNLVRRTGGGVFTGDLDATNDDAVVALQDDLEDGTVRPVLLAQGANVKLGDTATGPVQAQSYVMQAGDGETVSFDTPYDTPPVVIPVGVDNLLALENAGDYYLTMPVSITTSGFTGRARRRNPGTGGTLTGRTDDGDANATGTPGTEQTIIHRNKALSGVAYDQKYTATFSVATKSPPSLNPRSMVVGFYGRRVSGGAWTLLGQKTVQSSTSTTDLEISTHTIVGEIDWSTWDTVTGSGTDGYEYRLEIISGYQSATMYLTEFASVEYTESSGASGATDDTALSSGAKMNYLVIPQTSGSLSAP